MITGHEFAEDTADTQHGKKHKQQRGPKGGVFYAVHVKFGQYPDKQIWSKWGLVNLGIAMVASYATHCALEIVVARQRISEAIFGMQDPCNIEVLFHAVILHREGQDSCIAAQSGGRCRDRWVTYNLAKGEVGTPVGCVSTPCAGGHIPVQWSSPRPDPVLGLWLRGPGLGWGGGWGWGWGKGGWGWGWSGWGCCDGQFLERGLHIMWLYKWGWGGGGA